MHKLHDANEGKGTITNRPALPRLEYLDSLRGLAAMQVLFLHILSAFFPTFTNYPVTADVFGNLVHGSPLFFIYDGYSAVYIFFLLSGFILTSAFRNCTASLVKQIASRWIRLALPAIAASLIAAVVLASVGNANILIGTTVESPWYATLWQPASGIAYWFKDTFLNSLFLGYQEVSILTKLLPKGIFDSIYSSYVSPVWTLSIEFHGSIIILLLIYINKISNIMWIITFIVLSIIFFRTEYACFLIGHLLYYTKIEAIKVKLISNLSTLLIVSGILICWNVELGIDYASKIVCEPDLIFSIECSRYTQKIVGTILIFTGIIYNEPIQRFLKLHFLRQIGDYSFAVYLIHWPVIFGISPIFFNLTYGSFGLTVASLTASASAFVFTAIFAVGFRQVDLASIAFSRFIRSE